MAFNCYIDESGDEGIATGGTRWFILGAVIVSDDIDLKTSEMITRIKGTLGRDPIKPLHWADIRNHAKRIYICNELLTEDWIYSCVVTDKTHSFIQTAKGLPEKWNLYFYSTRLLLERLSWYARDNGGEKAKLIFEKRTNTDYKALGEYLLHLRRWIPPLEIRWDYLNWQNPKIIAKGKSRMLQASDSICGALSDALEYTSLGNIEPRYILALKDRFYRRGDNLFSYGLKFLHIKGSKAAVLAQHGQKYPWLNNVL